MKRNKEETFIFFCLQYPYLTPSAMHKSKENKQTNKTVIDWSITETRKGADKADGEKYKYSRAKSHPGK